MKDSEFKAQFIRSDSFGHMNQPAPKKRKGITIWMILIAIISVGLPIYMYLFLTGKMFEIDLIEKFFKGAELTAIYSPLKNSKPGKPWIACCG